MEFEEGASRRYEEDPHKSSEVRAMCVCEWNDGRVVSMCAAHYEAARAAWLPREAKTQQLEESLREVMKLIENNELVRNPAFDHMADWWKRMVVFVGVLKKAQELVGIEGQERTATDTLGLG